MNNKESSKPTVYEVKFNDPGPNPGCFGLVGPPFPPRIPKHGDPIELVIRNLSPRTSMDYTIELESAFDGDGKPIVPVPNPFIDNPSGRTIPAGGSSLLMVKGVIGIGPGGSVSGSIEPVNPGNCPPDADHTEWHIDC